MKKSLDTLLENFVNSILLEASKSQMIEIYKNNISKVENISGEEIGAIVQKINPLQANDQEKETYDLYILMQWLKDSKGAKKLGLHTKGVANENVVLNIRKHLEFFKLYVKPAKLKEKGMQENLNRLDLWELSSLINAIDSSFKEEYDSFISGVQIKEEEDDQPDCILKKVDGFEFQTRQGKYEAYRIMNRETLRKVGKATCWCVGVYDHFNSSYYNQSGNGSVAGHNFIIIVDSTSFEPKRKENPKPSYDPHYEPYKKVSKFPKKICTFNPALTPGLAVDPYNRSVLSIMAGDARSKISNCPMNKPSHQKESGARCAEELGIPVLTRFPEEVYYIMLKMSLPKPEGAGNNNFSWEKYPAVFWQSMPSKIYNEVFHKNLQPSPKKIPLFYSGLYHNTGLSKELIEKLLDLQKKKELPACSFCKASFDDHFEKNISFKLYDIVEKINSIDKTNKKEIDGLKKYLEKSINFKKSNIILSCLSQRVDSQLLGNVLMFIYKNYEDLQDPMIEKIQLMIHELKSRMSSFTEEEKEEEDKKKNIEDESEKSKYNKVDKGDFFKMICCLPELAKTFIYDDPEFFVNLAIPTEVFAYEKETVKFDEQDKEEGSFFVPRQIHIDINNSALNAFLRLASEGSVLKIPIEKIIYVFENVEKFSISKDTLDLLLKFLKDEDLVKYDQRAFEKIISKMNDESKQILLSKYIQAVKKGQSGSSGQVSKRKLEF